MMESLDMTMGFVLAFLVIGIVLIRRWLSRPVVLGQQLADAQAAESARLAAGPPGPSPMPVEQYDAERSDHDLVDVTPLDLDAELRSVVRSFAAASAHACADTRARISMDEQYTLLTFARRCAVLGVREQSTERCADALHALAMIDETRVDPRDAEWAAAIVGWAVRSIPRDHRASLQRAAALATSGMATILDSGSSAKLSGWGLMVIETERGLGLVQSGGAQYAPSCDLTGAARRIAGLLSQGKYAAQIEIASELPEVWFAWDRRGDAKKKLKRARAGVLTRGQLREAFTQGARMQMLLVWVVELPDPELAAALEADAQARSIEGGRFCVGFAEGRLFCMLVGGSWAVGSAPYESPESMREHAEAIRAIVKEFQ